ncbi:hypothetical protein ATY75_12125 [Rhizobium sp. N122]|uniref:helix-turn-helix domain-containing protein n=1 Tax=Rhizobium sp. N122 TaxID=1764272 RepID=UPI000B668B25|nr:helix-turn-helix domain-containing protein [Rhizobium sp. N122]OWV62563.1 hypothetical protein ATY75_12125 [Rhizobium sp. N122]
MITPVRQYSSAAENIRQAHIIRQRLMRPRNAVKAVPVLTVAHRALERPEQPDNPIDDRDKNPKDAHVLAWVSNNFNRISPCQAHMRQRCEELGITFEDLISKKRTRSIVRQRQLIIWEIKTQVKPSITLPELGRMFGGRDHTTCLWAIRQIEAQKHDK